MSLLANVKLRTGDFDNFWGVKVVLIFHMFIILLCEELVRYFSDVNNWYLIFTKVKSRYQILRRVKNRYQNLTSLKNW